MRVIKSDSGFLTYQKIFSHIQSNHSPVVIWQVNGSGERNISESRLNSFHLQTKLLHFELPSDYQMKADLPLYCYSEDGQFIFKTDIKDVRNNVFSLQVPIEIKLLEDPDVTFIKGSSGVDLAPVWRTKRLIIDEDQKPEMIVKAMSERSARDQEYLNMEFQLTLDEEDKMYADKRETPRARPKVDKFVKLLAETSEQQHYLKLFDLSQGGMGFITLEPDLFPKGSKILVLGFDEFDLDDPLIGQIMSHRPIDDGQIEFKIGCKFDEGQD